MNGSNEDRDRLLEGLGRAEQAVTAFYRVLLWIVIVAVVAVVASVIVTRPWGEGHQGEWFYFAIAVMLVLGWAVGQFAWLSRRQSGRRLPWSTRSNSQDGTFTWEFRIGSNADDPRTAPSAAGGRFTSSPLDEFSPKG